MRLLFTCYALAVCVAPLLSATYVVDGSSPAASDENAGTAEAPWKTISRACTADLRRGDTVRVRSGVYRESVRITASGEPGDPIVFEAEPGGRVVIKGSEIVRGQWTRVGPLPDIPEPYPNAFANTWKIQLGDEFFTDARFPGLYDDKSTRWVSQVFLDDSKALQRIGPDPIYKNETYMQLATVGRDLSDLIVDSFYFDPADQTLYVNILGEPAWYCVEVGVRGFALSIENAHDVVVRGFEVRHNRQPGGQWPMASVSGCERVTVEGCGFYQADFCGLGVGRSRDCAVRDCDLSYNGDTGLGMGECVGCVIEGCRALLNNYRRFFAGWHAGGMKCIPSNRTCTIRGCEVAFNTASDGIWFDSDNSEISIIGNICHHNGGAGIFFEINKGGGVIADNLVYANGVRGIYISGSQNTWVVHNTVVGNDCGIVAMPRGEDWPLENVFILSNLLLGNYTTGDTVTHGNDLTLYMGADQPPYERTVMSNHSDHNVYANNGWSPTMRHSWNPDNSLDQWRQRYGEDMNSRLMRVAWERKGTSFALVTTEGLEVASPLPAECPWKPTDPARVGSSITRWP